MAEIRYIICNGCETDDRNKDNKIFRIKLSHGLEEVVVDYCSRCLERIAMVLPEINLIIGKKMAKESKG